MHTKMIDYKGKDRSRDKRIEMCMCCRWRYRVYKNVYKSECLRDESRCEYAVAYGDLEYLK